MVDDRCGNCEFFDAERGDLCVRFPPPQQAIVRTMDWCGEYQRVAPVDEEPRAPPKQQDLARATLGAKRTVALSKSEHLKSFADLARVK